MTVEGAVVLLSGGLDSATVMAIARSEGMACHGLAFDYGQRHRSELQAAEQLAGHMGAASFRTVKLDLNAVGGSALTDPAIAVPEAPSEGIPVTYVPARNTLFLAHALGWAEVLACDVICIGVNAVDYSGYPDCRPAFIQAFEQLANVATKRGVEGNSLRIHAPLIDLSKAQIIARGMALGVDYSQTVSCYQADTDGAACGRCDSCRFRAQGFADAGVPDVTRYQSGESAD